MDRSVNKVNIKWIIKEVLKKISKWINEEVIKRIVYSDNWNIKVQFTIVNKKKEEEEDRSD